MSDGDAYEDEMAMLSRPSDRDLDGLIAGRAPDDGGDFDELASFVRELKQAFDSSPNTTTEARHLHAIAAAARLATHSAPLPAPTRPAPAKRRLWARPLVLAGALTLGLFCGVAYAGALPGPVQGAVADVAGNVGVSLPGAHNDKDEGAQNDKPAIVPERPQQERPTGPAQPSGTRGLGTPARQESGQQVGQKDVESGNQQAQQQQGQGGTENQRGDDGTNGNTGDQGSSGEQGSHGDDGGAHGGSTQSGGSQGGGQGGSGEHSRGDGNPGDGDN